MENSTFNESLLTESFTLNGPASNDEISKIPHVEMLPSDYIDFLKLCNGGHGSIGEEHLIVFRADEISQINQAADVERFAPGLLIFASNGGGQSYAFDLRDKDIKIVKFYDFDLGDEEPFFCAISFNGLLMYLIEQTT
jgi:hypothetical protein